MSNELQNKMYNYEVPPPPGAWDKIVHELDESHLTEKFPSLIYNASATPPAGVWEHIATELNEQQLSVQFPATLYNLEATPPQSAWEKISASLDEKDEPVHTRRRVIPLFVRYAAAAVFIGAIAFASINLLSNKKTDNGLAAEKTATPQNNAIENPDDNGMASNPSEEMQEEARNDAALEESKHTYASLDLSDKHRVSGMNEDLFLSPAATIRSGESIAPQQTYKDIECSEVHNALFSSLDPSIDMASRYSMLMTPNGQIIRISKKLGDLVCCVSGEDQDQECQDQLKKWRRKIADAPVAPSPGNFMDILSLLQSIKEPGL
jgi:hypothetical protein